MSSAARLDTVEGPKARILIFSRLPRKGSVKSRFARDAGEDAALDLQRAMIRDLLRNLSSMAEGDPLAEALWTADGEPGGSELAETFGALRVERQEGADLGERMSAAFTERFYLRRAEKIVAIGTDLPTVTAHDLSVALALLDSCDWVIGPATDGGYYLLGCNAGAWKLDILKGIAWGGSSVREATIGRIRAEGQTVALLPERRDIDHLNDLLEFDGEELRTLAPDTWTLREALAARV